MTRAITVRQPWAWAIVHGGKGVENRSRNIAGAYRGAVLVHAGRDVDVFAWDDATLWHALPRGTQVESFRKTLGAVIGVVDLVDVHHWLDDDVCFGHEATDGAVCSPWAMADHYHLVLTNPRPLPSPIPARGRLGLWRPDADLLAAVREQIGDLT